MSALNEPFAQAPCLPEPPLEPGHCVALAVMIVPQKVQEAV
ncbi:MAG TPA: hypothetical protein VHZ73_06575 [Vicinamibacterales bacterium]|nr:hypothetical protein [Vicinamibacterales bacterium]